MTLENLISLAMAARLLPGNPSPATIWRWRTAGIRGIRLQTWQVGGRIYTSQAALEAFVAATTAAATHTDDAPAERSADTTKRLQAAGVLN